MTAASSVRATLSRSLRHLLPAALALATATCTRDSVGPSDTGVGYFTFRPTYQLAGGASLAQFGIVADSVHIVLTRPVDQLVLDTSVAFPADSTELRLALPVTLDQSPDTLDAVIEMSAGGVVIFRDSLRVEVIDGPPNPGSIPTVVFEYVGPGTNIKTIDITPDDTTIALGDTIFFAATAVDSFEVPVPAFYVGWSTSDTAVARINANGRLIAPTRRGTVRVVGITPTGIVDSTTLTIAPVPVIVTRDSGDAQSAPVGDSLPEFFVVTVKAADSLGVAGIPVRFAAVSGNGGLRDTLVLTDVQGRARTRAVLDTAAGAYSWSATVVGTALAPVTFTATATTLPPSAIAIVSGDAQVDTAGQTLPLPFVVHVTDAFTNPVAGVAVAFARVFGNGTVADDTVFTNATGDASVGYTLGGPAGTDSITATIAGTSAFVSFTATATAAAPTVISIVSGNAQVDTVTQALPLPFAVLVTDAFANPVSGVAVVFVRGQGSGTLADDTLLTDAGGLASVGYTLGTTAGTDSITATITGTAAFVHFTATGTAGAASTMTIGAGNGQSGNAGSALAVPPTVHVVDAFGNVVAGVAVDFMVTAGSGSIDSATATTNAAGDANAGAWTLGPVAGSNQVRATSAAVPADTLLFDAVAAPAGTSKIWTGASNTDFTDPSNWSPAGAPGITDNIFIAASAPSAVLSSATTIGDLIIESGATLTANAQLTVSGTLQADGTLAGSGVITLTGSGASLRGTITNPIVNSSANRTMTGTTAITGTLNVNAGLFTTGGGPLSIGGNLTVAGSGRFAMTSLTDSTDVGGNVVYSTSNAGVGDLAGGVLVIRGNFNQVAGNTANFAADNNHRVRFAGPGPQTISFTSPGAVASHFNKVEFATAGGVTLSTDIVAYGSATVTAGTVTGIGRTAVLGGGPGSGLVATYANWQVSTTQFDGTPDTYPDSLPRNVQVNGVWAVTHRFKTDSSFTLTATGVLNLNGNHLRIGGNFTQTGLFRMPTAADTVEVGGTMLVNGSLQGVGDLNAGLLLLRGDLIQSAGVTDNFQPGGTHLTRFAGSAPQTVTFSASGLNQSRFNNVEFANAASVQFNTSFSVAGNASVLAGQVAGATRTATLAGSLVATNAAWQVGTTTFTVTPVSYPDSLALGVNLAAPLTLAHSLTVGGDLTITPAGALTIGGQTLTVGGNFTQSGAFLMTSPADSVEIGGDLAVNSSVDGTGDLTAGALVLHGALTQNTGSLTNFVAAPTHRVRFAGAASHAISFSSPDSTRLGDVEIDANGTLLLGNDLTVLGTLKAVGGVHGISAAAQQVVRTAGLAIDGMTLDRVRVQMNSGVNAMQFDNVTFTNIDPTLTQLSLELPGNDIDTLKLDGVTFAGVPTTGQYVVVADSAADDANANVAFYNSSPLNGSAFTAVEGSAGDTPNVLWSHLEWQTEPSIVVEGVAVVPSPEVRAVDPAGVVMTGYTNTITLVIGDDPSGGAAVLGGNTADPINGIATFGALTISLAGAPYTLRASSPELGLSAATAPFTVDIPLPVGTTTAFNNGGGDNDWFNASNWTSGVPDSADNIYVQAGQTVTVNSAASANRVILGAGAGIVLNAPLTVDSSVVAGNTISGGGQLVARGSGELSGQVGDLLVTGSYTVPSSETLSAQSINISGASASLDPGTAQITALDSLRTEAGGVLNVGYSGATVNVQGLARFTGGPSSLTAGTLNIGGDFSQEESVGAFSPDSAFTTAFNGGGVQTATFLSPDSASDHFGHLMLTGGGTLHLAGVVPILGDLDLSGGTVVVDSITFIAGNVSGSTGAFLQGATLQVAGNLGFGGVYTMAHTVFVGTGQTILPLSSGYDTLSVMGTALLGGRVTANTVLILGTGQLSMGGHRMDVAGDFTTVGDALFGMQDPADTLVVGGNFLAGGGNTDGLLTAGLLEIAGNFDQVPSTTFGTFRASAGHVTRFIGAAAAERTIHFGTPVEAADPFSTDNSRFGDLELANGTDSVSSTIPVAGNLVVVSAGVTNVTAGGGGPAVGGNVQIQSAVPLFTVSTLGVGGTLDFQPAAAVYQVGTTLFFGTTQSIPALPYNDIEVVFGQASLTSDLSVGNVRTGASNEGPGFPGDLKLAGHALTVSGNFSTTGAGTFTMDDPADSLDVTGQVDLGGGPTPAISAGTIVARGDLYLQDSVFVATGTSKLVFAAPASQQLWITAAHDNGNLFNDVTVLAGTTVNFNAFQYGSMEVGGAFWVNGYFQQASSSQKVVTYGDLYAGAAASFVVDTVELHADLQIDASLYSTQVTRYAGTGQLIAPANYNDIEITGTVAMDSNVTVTRDVTVLGTGSLDLGAVELAAGRNFRTQDDATVTLAAPTASLVADTAIFGGASTAGRLTAGTVHVRSLIQDNGISDSSYYATGTLLTQIGTPSGGTEYLIQMATGDGRSRIASLLLNDGGFGGVPTRIIGHALVTGTMTLAAEASGDVVSSGGAVLEVNDTLRVDNPSIDFLMDTLVLRGALLVPNNTFANTVTRFAGTGMVVPDTQNYAAVEITGTATPEPAVIAQRTRIYGNGRLTINGGQGWAGNVLRTEENGTLEMAGPTAQLQVLDTLVMAGGSTAGLLRQGSLTLSGDLVQSDATSPASFAVDSQMNTFFTDPAGQYVTFATAGNAESHFGFVHLQSGAVVNMAAPQTIPVWGEMHIQSGAALNSTAGIDVAQNMTSDIGTSVTAPLFIFRNGSAPDASSPWNVGRTAIATPDTMNIPQLTYGGDLEIWTQGRFVYPITVNGTLRVGGNGSTAYGSWSAARVTTAGLDIIDNSRIGMTNPGDSLVINGAAHFDGAYITDQLTGGVIIFGGDVSQDTSSGPMSFGASGTSLVFTPGVSHKLSFASPDGSPWPQLTTGGLGGELDLLIVGRLVAAEGGLIANGLNISGDTLVNNGPLDAGSSPIKMDLKQYVGTVFDQFANLGSWNVTTTQFTTVGHLPYSDLVFDTLIVSDSLVGQLSQILTATYVEVTGPGNPRHVGAEPGVLVLAGGDGNTTLKVAGDVVVRGTDAGIASYEGDLDAGGNLIVEEKGWISSNGSFGGAGWKVAGSASFDGASTRDSLVQGTLEIGGDLIQGASSSNTSFAADSGFTVVFRGSGGHKVYFATPGAAPEASHFGSLAFDTVPGVVLQTETDLWVEGTFTTQNNWTPVLQNTGGTLHSLVVRDVAVLGVEFDHLQLRLEKSSAPAAGAGNLDAVKFSNFLPSEDQFVVDLPGSSLQFDWGGFNFTQLNPGDTGHYVVATDTDGSVPDVLSIMLGTNNWGVNDPPFYVALNGAILNPFAP